MGCGEEAVTCLVDSGGGGGGGDSGDGHTLL